MGIAKNPGEQGGEGKLSSRRGSYARQGCTKISIKYLQMQIKFLNFFLSFPKIAALHKRNQRVQVQIPYSPCPSFKSSPAKAPNWQKSDKIEGYQTILKTGALGRK